MCRRGWRGRADTLDAPLEKSLAALAGPHAVVVTRGVVVTHGAEVHVGFPDRRGTRGVHAFGSFLRPLPQRLVAADDGAAGRNTDSVKKGQLDIWNFSLSSTCH